MKTAAIIAEYNPFHNGHQYQIEETRRRTEADFILVLMSGDFVQRGAPALCNKYIRTKMALLGGADLVIELPCLYALSSAEFFAGGAVALLNQLNVVDILSFGSESGNLSLFEKCTDAVIRHDENAASLSLLHGHRQCQKSFLPIQTPGNCMHFLPRPTISLAWNTAKRCLPPKALSVPLP